MHLRCEQYIHRTLFDPVSKISIMLLFLALGTVIGTAFNVRSRLRIQPIDARGVASGLSEKLGIVPIGDKTDGKGTALKGAESLCFRRRRALSTSPFVTTSLHAS